MLFWCIDIAFKKIEWDSSDFTEELRVFINLTKGISFNLRPILMIIYILSNVNSFKEFQRFLAKNQHNQRKLLYFVNTMNGIMLVFGQKSCFLKLIIFEKR